MSLRIAVVGLGQGTGFAELAAKHPRTELVAVVDIDQEKREKIAARFGVANYASWQELLAANVADTVCLALPTPLHRQSTIDCLQAGLHVLQEKPLCLTLEEAEAIGAAVDASDKVFQVGYEVRSSPLHRSILDHIARGDLGQLTNIWYNQHSWQKDEEGTWRFSRANMGGKLFDCAVHYLDLVQQWAGAPVHRVVALGNLLGKTGPNGQDLPESAIIAIEYANGVRSSFNFGGVHKVNDDASFGLIGTRGRIVGNPWLPEGAGSYEIRLDNGIRKGHIVFDGKLTSTGHLGWREQFEHFVAACLDGGPNVAPFADALALHHQMLAIDRSLATGEVITL